MAWLSGVDTPERGQCFFFTRATTVTERQPRDDGTAGTDLNDRATLYGRLLYVWLPGGVFATSGCLC